MLLAMTYVNKWGAGDENRFIYKVDNLIVL